MKPPAAGENVSYYEYKAKLHSFAYKKREGRPEGRAINKNQKKIHLSKMHISFKNMSKKNGK
jgi:hypothetical protein